MMRLLFGIVVMLMTMANAHANNASCQAGTGLSPSPLVALCVQCESGFPVSGTKQDNSYNILFGNLATGCTLGLNWELTAHIAGYSGDGIHDTMHPGEKDLTNGGLWDCTDGGRYDYTEYPSINTNKTTWSSYDQTNYPPKELGHTASTPIDSLCSRVTLNMDKCVRWTKWILQENDTNGNYTSLTEAQYDIERSDIGYDSCGGKSGDGCFGEDLGAATAGDNDGYKFVCGTNSTKTSIDWRGNMTGGHADLLPLELNVDGVTLDAPAELFCTEPLGDATIDASGNFKPDWNADASSSYPIYIDAAFQTNSRGGHVFDDQLEADIYITHDGGHKGWHACTVEYDARLTPCSGTSCP